MFTLVTWGRFLLAACMLGLPNVRAFAAGHSSTPTSATTDATSERGRAGDPALGVLIIVGIAAFLVLIAWLFSRASDDRNRGPDRTLL